MTVTLTYRLESFPLLLVADTGIAKGATVRVLETVVSLGVVRGRTYHRVVKQRND